MKWVPVAVVLLTLAGVSLGFGFGPLSITIHKVVDRARPRLLSSFANTLVEIVEGTNRDVPTFEDYALQCGVQRCNGFQLVIQDNQDGIVDDYSVMTTEDLPAGSPVVAIPQYFLLTSFQAPQEFGSALDEAEEELTESVQEYNSIQTPREIVNQFRLFIKVLSEYEKGVESPWFPWFNSLPRRFNNAAAMTDACFECLLPYVAELSITERTNSVNFQKWAKMLTSSNVLQPNTVTNIPLLKVSIYSCVLTSPRTNHQRTVAICCIYYKPTVSY